MRVTDAQLAEVWDRGWTVVEGFVEPELLEQARAGLWRYFPRPEDYFADPEKHARFSRSQFAGMRYWPYDDWALNALTVHPDLVDAAERFCGTEDIELYKVELWAKYAGAIDYDQTPHRDFGNHTLVAPRLDGAMPQMTTFILLSDVTEVDAPTKLVPLECSRDVPLMPLHKAAGTFADVEVAATAPAGSMLIYKTDVMHRGTNFGAPGRSRFVLLADFQKRGWRWQGKMHWANHGMNPAMAEAIVRMTPRQRDLFGWPPAGSDYWNAQTLADTAARYPGIDMGPYAGGVPPAVIPAVA